MNTLLYIILGTTVIAFGALAGIFTVGLKKEVLNKILLSLVGLSSGAMLGVAFIHLIPEGIEDMSPDLFFPIVMFTIVLYLLIEKALHWRHCHRYPNCPEHNTIGYMNLIGDSVHNFIDGLVVASAFVASPVLGFSTVAAIALHEIPQEIGDYAVLIYAGFEKKRALFLNFLVALTVVLGGICGWALTHFSSHAISYMIPVAVGGFIYISLSDVLPIIRRESGFKKFLSGFVFVLIGMILMMLLRD